MKEVLTRTKPKAVFTLVLHSNYIQSSTISGSESVNLETHYSFGNIRQGNNNSFKRSVEDVLKSTNPTKRRNKNNCVFDSFDTKCEKCKMKRVSNTDIKKVNWRFNHMFFVITNRDF